jgi:hypothetical protein
MRATWSIEYRSEASLGGWVAFATDFSNATRMVSTGDGARSSRLSYDASWTALA